MFIIATLCQLHTLRGYTLIYTSPLPAPAYCLRRDSASFWRASCSSRSSLRICACISISLILASCSVLSLVRLVVRHPLCMLGACVPIHCALHSALSLYPPPLDISPLFVLRSVHVIGLRCPFCMRPSFLALLPCCTSATAPQFALTTQFNTGTANAPGASQPAAPPPAAAAAAPGIPALG